LDRPHVTLTPSGLDTARRCTSGYAYDHDILAGVCEPLGLDGKVWIDLAYLAEISAGSFRTMGDAVPTVYEWGGGREAFARWLSLFYDLVEREAPEIAAMFGGHVSEEHRAHVTDWWVEVMGGPAVYSEQRGGYEHMLARHRDLAITQQQRLTFVTLLSRAADDAGLPTDPEFRAAIMSYAEWGSRLAMHNSQPAAPTVSHAPVPRWGWGVAPPYIPAGGAES
jgi:hemoglobin